MPGRIQLNGHPTARLPNTLNISIDGVTGPELLDATPDVAAATGSACHEGDSQASPVLTAMGHDHARADSALRLSLGRWTSADDVERAVDLLAKAAAHPS